MSASMRELVVVGGGPAGMAAAGAAASRGVAVTLVDAAERLGGQIYRQAGVGHPGSPVDPAGRAHAASLPRRFARLDERVEVLGGWNVWHVEADAQGVALELVGQQDERPGSLTARAVVLAPGASELALPFPGWDLPGVTTAGAAQALLKSQGRLVGRRVVVGGSGPFLLPVAAALARGGATVVAVVEAALPRRLSGAAGALALHGGKLAQALGYLRTLARHRVPVLPGSAVLSCEGDGRVERAVIGKVDARLAARADGRRLVPVDAVCVSFGFVPRLELLRQLAEPGEPAPPGVFLAGEVTGIGGATVAGLEGTLAGATAASYLGHRPTRRDELSLRRLRLQLRHAQRLAAALERAYALGRDWTSWLEPGTAFCRCEDVPFSAVAEAVAEGATTARAVRGVTRCGMGYCQGRTCGPALQLAIASLTGASPEQVGDLQHRPIAVPLPLGAVAEEPPVLPLSGIPHGEPRRP